jgi:hypothetical protein
MRPFDTRKQPRQSRVFRSVEALPKCLVRHISGSGRRRRLLTASSIMPDATLLVVASRQGGLRTFSEDELFDRRGVKFIPLGGISVTNARSYLAPPIVAAIGGSWIADRKLIAEHQWSTITSLAAESVAIVSSSSRPCGTGPADRA